MNKFRHILLIIFWICIFFNANAQSDTVYIYEDLIVYDTVVVYDTLSIKAELDEILPQKLKPITLLQLDTINHQTNLFLISDKKTATFPINHIILDENFNKNIKNSESMKKLSFFGVVFFAFQAIVIAQTNYEIAIGSGIWWEKGNLNYVNKPYSSLVNVDFFAKRNFTGRNFGLKTGFEYSYLLGSNDYKFDGTVGIWHSEIASEFESINSNYNAGLHSISIPILIYFDRYKIQPFVGFNYNYLATGIQTSSTGTKYFSDSHNFGLNFGMNFKISKSFAINIEYKQNLTCDYGETIYYEGNNSSNADNTVFGSSFNLKNAQTKLSIVYSLSKSKK